MKLITITLIGIFLVGTSNNTSAGLVCTIKSHNSAKQGVLMKPGKSGEFYSLIENELYEEAARCCVSCTAPIGTKVIITDQGFASHTVRVLEGASRGCVGDLPAEFVGNCN